MSVLEQLEPKSVMSFFEQMCAIPHGSRNTKAISDWCVAFAKERGLEYHQDEANNVIIIKEATPGYESAEPVILQGHLDMVCEKAAGCEKDMDREGLDLAVDGDYVYAKGTTLGSDDGIAVAMAMAVAAALDALHFNEIVGCIAGDDTIMCAVRSVQETVEVMGRLRKIVEE